MNFFCSFCHVTLMKDFTMSKKNLNKLLTYIVETEKDTGREILTESEKAELRNLLPRRNYWVHNCYTEIKFDSKTEDISNWQSLNGSRIIMRS